MKGLKWGFMLLSSLVHPLTVLSLGCCCCSCFISRLLFLSLHRLFWNQTRITLGLRPVISTSCSFISASGLGLAL